MSGRGAVDNASLGRVVQAVATHNKLAEENAMWREHRRQQQHGGETSASAEDQATGSAVTNTPASLIKARREAELRKLAARQGAEQAVLNSGVESSSSDSDEGSSSSSSSRERKRKHRREKRKSHKEKKERKSKKSKSKKDKAKKKKKPEKKKRKRARSPSPLPSVMGASFADEEAATIGAEQQQEQQQQRPPQEEASRTLGAQRPEDAAAEAERAQRVHVVYDATLGVHRSVRESGEVVEQCVSRGEQQRLMHAKARHVGPSGPPPPETYTGKDKFPSQHPWHGYK